MPHPRNLMKQTGDIHPPEVEYDLDIDRDAGPQADTTRTEPPGRVSMPATMALSAPETGERSFEEAARAQVRRKPIATLAAGFALGFVLVKLFR